MSPRFTVGIPTFNRAATYLPMAIRAVLQQSFADFELIVSDNGSSDATQDVVCSLTDSRIRYIRHARTMPAGEHFASLAAAARGAWFVLHQDDDSLNRSFLERANEALQSDAGSDMYAAPIWRQARNHGYHARLMRPQQGYDDPLVLREGILTFDGRYAAIQFFDPIRHFVHPTVAIRCAALRAIGGYDPGNGYQSDLVTQAKVLLGSRLLYDTRPGGVSHVHGTNFMRGQRRSFRKQFFRETYLKLIAAFEERGTDWRGLLAAYLGALSFQEIVDCLKEWTYYRTPYDLQRIGFRALRQAWQGSGVGFARKCASRVGVRNLVRYAWSSLGAG